MLVCKVLADNLQHSRSPYHRRVRRVRRQPNPSCRTWQDLQKTSMTTSYQSLSFLKDIVPSTAPPRRISDRPCLCGLGRPQVAGTPVDDFASVKRPSGVSHDLGLHSRSPWNAPGLSSPSIRLLESAKVFVQQILTPIFGPVVTIAKAGKTAEELRPAKSTHAAHSCHNGQNGVDSSRESGCCFCAGKRSVSGDFALPFPTATGTIQQEYAPRLDAGPQTPRSRP